MARGRLITIEGLDGAGKTTLAVALGDALRARGVDAELLREPGGVRVAELIRELVKDPELRIGARSEALLYAAARAQLVDEALEPLLARGAIVLLDRFVDSSLAYQGAGRELGVERIREVNEFATGGLAPDLTLLLIVEPSVGRDRSSERSPSRTGSSASPTSSSSGSRTRIASSRARTRSGSSRSMRPSRLRLCWPLPCARSRT